MGTSTQIEPTNERAERVDQVGQPDGRDETSMERLDRNSIELMGQLRVAGTGIQVLLAFLLIVPFNARWSEVSAFERDVYFVTLLCIAAAAALLIAPTVHHRILFHRGEKDYLVTLGNRLAIIAMVLLTIGLTGILLLISDVLFGGVAAGLVGAAALIGVGGLWFGLPLRQASRR
ncbi:MAG TPA: DUF6328 family protein [Solirubrobacteraceae bacterium]|jgi:uncharacterized membrane protein YiaA|nr:DUF6328 family protein [Solirubrobacteraceae bacterium]